MRGPGYISVHSVRSLEAILPLDTPRRPQGIKRLSWRLWCAWQVFTGKADALVWYGQ